MLNNFGFFRGSNAPDFLILERMRLLPQEKMRLDKYLKVSRLIKRRTVANEVCDAKHVTVNGKIARASYDVKVGDVIEISMGQNVTRARVLNVAETVRKEDAAAMYEIL